MTQQQKQQQQQRYNNNDDTTTTTTPNNNNKDYPSDTTTTTTKTGPIIFISLYSQNISNLFYYFVSLPLFNNFLIHTYTLSTQHYIFNIT